MSRTITLAQGVSGGQLKKLRAELTSGIYGLVDTREPGRVRYVGSSETIEHRLYAHWHSATGGRLVTPRSDWIRSIRAEGAEIAAVVLWEGVIGAPQSNVRHDIESDFIESLCVSGQCDLNVRLTPVGHRNSLDTTGKKLFSENKQLRRELDELRTEFAEYRTKHPATCNTTATSHRVAVLRSDDNCNATHHVSKDVVHALHVAGKSRSEFEIFCDLA